MSHTSSSVNQKVLSDSISSEIKARTVDVVVGGRLKYARARIDNEKTQRKSLSTAKLERVQHGILLSLDSYNINSKGIPSLASVLVKYLAVCL